MNLLDSNILIYAPQPAYTHIRHLLSAPNSCVSEITMLEVLGYHKLTYSEKYYYEVLFANIQIINIDRSIILKAVELRQANKMSIGDAIQAATAIINNYNFYTRNINDFDWISGLNIINPI
jgi:toxin FitB